MNTLPMHNSALKKEGKKKNDFPISYYNYVNAMSTVHNLSSHRNFYIDKTYHNMSKMTSDSPEFKKFYNFPAFTLDYTDQVRQIL